MTTNPQADQAARIGTYYEFQSRIYDLTRWSFLFGRRRILQLLPLAEEAAFDLLEVGCGTGHNLLQARQYYPAAKLMGLDVSPDMLAIARKRLTQSPGIQLLQLPYEAQYYSWTGKLDVVLFSYVLTMINPQWEELIAQAYEDLRPGGYVAVVDFHDSQWPFFKRHMAKHHVRMDGHLLPALRDRFEVQEEEVRPAYGGLWHYFTCIARKP